MTSTSRRLGSSRRPNASGISLPRPHVVSKLNFRGLTLRVLDMHFNQGFLHGTAGPGSSEEDTARSFNAAARSSPSLAWRGDIGRAFGLGAMLTEFRQVRCCCHWAPSSPRSRSSSSAQTCGTGRRRALANPRFGALGGGGVWGTTHFAAFAPSHSEKVSLEMRLSWPQARKNNSSSEAHAARNTAIQQDSNRGS